MAIDSSIRPYTPAPFVGTSAEALGRELGSIKRALDGVINMTPQAATRVPQNLQDGMLRLARAPWWPAAGQVADGWVYYNQPTDTWMLL